MLRCGRIVVASQYSALRRGIKSPAWLRDAGYVEGRNIAIERRVAEGDYNRVPELIADLVRSNVEIIVIDSTVDTEVAKRTTTIPIVMALVVDPVGSGLVGNLKQIAPTLSIELSFANTRTKLRLWLVYKRMVSVVGRSGRCCHRAF